MEQHIGLVHHVARKMAGQLSTEADVAELVSAGAVGLVQAAESFDADRGLSFSTYAVPRIRGAILDELRKQDHAPRNVRRRMRELTRARRTLTGALGRRPTVRELAAGLSLPVDVVQRWEFDALGARMCSLDQRVLPGHAEGGLTLGDTVTDERACDVDDRLTREAEVRRLGAAIATLKEQERTVLALSFFEELKLQEIATVLRLSVCRISQIRSAALAKLRVALSDLRAA